MTSKTLPALAFLGLLIGLVIGMVLVFGERIQPRDVWGPAPHSEPVETEVP